MRLEEDSPLWEKEIDMLKSLLKICCNKHRDTLIEMFIADHGPIPDRFWKEIKELFGEQMD